MCGLLPEATHQARFSLQTVFRYMAGTTPKAGKEMRLTMLSLCMMVRCTTGL